MVHTGLYVAIPVYFCFLVFSAVWAYLRVRKADGNKADHLSTHYLGGRNFGPILTAGSIFASLFSGYTVVGVVNESFKFGWHGLRWMSTDIGIIAFYVGLGLRLRKLSLVRNHQSPVDFITDRYQSQVLRYGIMGLQIVVSVIYCAAQVSALKSTFNSMFDISPDSPVAVIVMFIIILLFEWAGGLTSVALTDCVQGFIMVLSFVMVAGVIKRNYGGWTALDPATFPNPALYQTPSSDSQWSFWQFTWVNMGFFALPHFMQRLYAADSLHSLKVGWTVMTVGPWATMFVSIFMGTVGVVILDGNNGGGSSPFASILEAFIDLGGFAEFVGIIAFTASLAAIMSTADSLIIGISQLITTEIVYPQKPDATPKQIAWAARLVSLVSVGFALLIGLLWKQGVNDLAKIQFPLMLMVVPAFVWGLFAPDRYNVHPWCLAIGAYLGSVYVILVYFLYMRPEPDAVPIDAGMTGLGINLFATVALEAVRRLRSNNKNVNEWENKPAQTEQDGIVLEYGDRPDWDVPKLSRFGDTALTYQLMETTMHGVKEPLRNLWYASLIFFTGSLITPLVPEFEPPLVNGEFLVSPATVRGLPWWAFKIIILCIIPYLFLMATVLRIPKEFPNPQDNVDPNALEMTGRELSRQRLTYDAKNELVSRRRSSLSSQANMNELSSVMRRRSSSQSQATDELHFNIVPPNVIHISDESRRKLKAMVMGSAELDDLDIENGSRTETLEDNF